MKKTFQELYDETLIANLGEEGNICDISIGKLRSPSMKKLHIASCPVCKKEKDTYETNNIELYQTYKGAK